MSACTLPITSSPGKLALIYNHNATALTHRISWNFIAGVDLTAVSLIAAEADRLANLMKLVLTDEFVISNFAILSRSGGVYYEAPLSAAQTGVKPPAAGAAEWASTTLTFVGTGNPPTPGTCHGKSISRLFVGASYLFTPQMKYLPAGGYPGLLDFIVNGLNASLYLPADTYGQQADILTNCPVQWNAAAQRRDGS